MISKVCKPDKFELYKSLKEGLTNTWSFCSNFVGCESSFESNSEDIDKR